MSQGGKTEPALKSKRKAATSVQPGKRRQTKGSGSKHASDSSESLTEIDSSSWSVDFRQLEQVFRSLNTVYTFCCTRKHFPTTFDNLKSSVENLTRRFHSWPFFGC